MFPVDSCILNIDHWLAGKPTTEPAISVTDVEHFGPFHAAQFSSNFKQTLAIKICGPDAGNRQQGLIKGGLLRGRLLVGIALKIHHLIDVSAPVR